VGRSINGQALPRRPDSRRPHVRHAAQSMNCVIFWIRSQPVAFVAPWIAPIPRRRPAPANPLLHAWRRLDGVVRRGTKTEFEPGKQTWGEFAPPASIRNHCWPRASQRTSRFVSSRGGAGFQREADSDARHRCGARASRMSRAGDLLCTGRPAGCGSSEFWSVAVRRSRPHFGVLWATPRALGNATASRGAPGEAAQAKRSHRQISTGKV